MEMLEQVAVIIALIAGFGYIVDLIVRPLKRDIAKHETELKEIKDNQAKLEKGQVRFEIELKEIKAKLDQLLARKD